MGMIYSAVFSSVAVTAQQDFFELTVPATKVVIVHSVELSQSADVGDAASEGLAILHKRGVGTTSGSGGTTPGLVKFETGAASAAVIAEANNTTKMTGGTSSTLRSSNWIIQAPYLWLPTPETRHILAPSERYTVELLTTPADSITVSGEIVFEELG